MWVAEQIELKKAKNRKNNESRWKSRIEGDINILAKSAKIRRYRQKIEHFSQNRVFDSDLKKAYAEFNGDGVRLNHVPNPEERKRLRGNIWSVGKLHNREAEWLKDIRNKLGNNEHLPKRVVISVEKVTKQ